MKPKLKKKIDRVIMLKKYKKEIQENNTPFNTHIIVIVLNCLVEWYLRVAAYDGDIALLQL